MDAARAGGRRPGRLPPAQAAPAAGRARGHARAGTPPRSARPGQQDGGGGGGGRSRGAPDWGHSELAPLVAADATPAAVPKRRRPPPLTKKPSAATAVVLAEPAPAPSPRRLPRLRRRAQTRLDELERAGQLNRESPWEEWRSKAEEGTLFQHTVSQALTLRRPKEGVCGVVEPNSKQLPEFKQNLVKAEMEDHHLFWAMRDLAMSLPDSGSPHGEEDGVESDRAQDADDRPPYLEYLLRRQEQRWQREQIERKLEALGDKDRRPEGLGEKERKVRERELVRLEKRAAAYEEHGWRRQEDGKMPETPQWPGRAGINTIDEHFGWNLAMHCAALGKFSALKELIDYRPEVREEREEREEREALLLSGDIASSAPLDPPPVPLDLGHKASKEMDLSKQCDRCERMRNQLIKLTAEDVWRGSEIARHYKGRARQEENQVQPHPQMSTALSIAHSVSARGAEPKIGQRMKKDIVKAMKKAKEMRMTGHTLASLTDGSIDYTDEASDRYQEGMEKSNMFAECAVAKILLHFKAALRRSGDWISASQLVEYKASPIDLVEAGPEPEWEKVSMQELEDLTRNGTIRGETLIRKETDDEPQSFREIESKLVRGREIDEAKKQQYQKAWAAFHAWKFIDPHLISVGVEKLGELFMAAVKHGFGARGKPDQIRVEELGIAITMLKQLGKRGMDILDFTRQDDAGRTIKHLIRHIHRAPLAGKLADEEHAVKQLFACVARLIPESSL